MESLVELSADRLPSIVPGVTLLDEGTFENEAGDELGFIEIIVPADVYGSSRSVQQKQIYIQLPKVGMMLITYTTTADQYADVVTEFDEIIDSFVREN